jgi:hypothetical protein
MKIDFNELPEHQAMRSAKSLITWVSSSLMQLFTMTSSPLIYCSINPGKYALLISVRRVSMQRKAVAQRTPGRPMATARQAMHHRNSIGDKASPGATSMRWLLPSTISPRMMIRVTILLISAS